MAYLEADYAENFEAEDQVVYIDDAKSYAEELARETLAKYIAQTEKPQKESTMSSGITETANAVVKETELNAKLIGGEILLDNIETLADRLVLSRLSWWKRLTISKTDKEMAVTLATYAIVHAIKTGGFGLTSYRINHKALDFVTVAANQRLLKYVMKTVGVDMNIAEMLLTAPTVTVAAAQ